LRLYADAHGRVAETVEHDSAMTKIGAPRPGSIPTAHAISPAHWTVIAKRVNPPAPLARRGFGLRAERGVRRFRSTVPRMPKNLEMREECCGED